MKDLRPSRLTTDVDAYLHESQKTIARRRIDKAKLTATEHKAYQAVEKYINEKIAAKKWVKLPKAKKPRRCAPAFPRVQKGG